MNRQLAVSVGLIQYEDRLLLTRRLSPDRPQWHQRWEFPGGKIQADEVPLEALHREILEETGLTIHFPHLLGVHTHFWRLEKETQQTFILVYHCIADHQRVQLSPKEHDASLWVKPQDILEMDHLLDGTVNILKELYLKKELSLR